MIISSGTKSDLLAFKSYNNQNNAVASIKSEQSCRYVDRGTYNVECIYNLHTKKHDIPLLMSFRILIEFLSWKVVLWQPASCVRKRFVLVVTASAVMWVWGLGRDGAPVTACRTRRRGRGGGRQLRQCLGHHQRCWCQICAAWSCWSYWNSLTTNPPNVDWFFKGKMMIALSSMLLNIYTEDFKFYFSKYS